MPAENATRILGEFVAGASKATLPEDLFSLAQSYILDTVGAMIVGATQPWAGRLAASCTIGGGGGPSTIVGSEASTSPQLAALANGTMAHGFEIDDVHDESLVHPGAVVVPAALAIAQQHPCSGDAFLVSVILGYEMIARAGLGVGAVSHMLSGFYPTGTNGVFGAAAAAGRLLGCDGATMTSAFGLAGSFASGVVEFARSGSVVKWLHAGRAAEGGITAVLLAKSGIVGPATILEGAFGYCRSFSRAPELHRLLEGLGSEYKIRAITVKPYACCSDIHPVVDALLEIKEKHACDPADIVKIEVESTTKLLQLNNIDGTTSLMAAKYSVPFSAALVLTRDIRDPEIYRKETLDDLGLRNLQKLVEMRATDEFDRTYPHRIGARVVVWLKDGRTFTAVNTGALGSIHRPLSKAQIEDKFMRLADRILPVGRAASIARVVSDLPHLANAAVLADHLKFDVNQYSSNSDKSVGKASEWRTTLQ